MPGPIDLITADPDENDPATIAAEIDLFVQQIKAAIPQFNAAANAFNFNATNSTSTDSLTISVGTKTLNFGAGKSYQKGMALTLAYSTDPTQWMRGEVLTYDSGTGAGTFNSRVVSATTGTHAAWTISQAAVEGLVNYSEVIVHTGNGHAATDTKIRRYTTAKVNAGTGITYSDSAANGGLFTFNESGIYKVRIKDASSSGACNYGFSINSAQLTTNVESITDSFRKILVTTSAANIQLGETELIKIAAGDVGRVHTDGSPNLATVNALCSILKVANI